MSDTNLHTVHKTTHRLLRTTATTPSAEHHMQQNTTCTPEDGHIDATVSRIQTHTQCTRLDTVSLGPQPQHLVLNTTCSSTQPALLKMGI